MNPRELRKHFRQLRAGLSAQQQARNAAGLAYQLDAQLSHLKSRRIAGYLATGGEISLTAWLSANHRHRIYLPKLYEPIEPRLRFAPWNRDTEWTRNRFRIVEPRGHWGQTLHARQLDIILLPLVAFDRSGSRLGMGGGFYDRSLAFRRHRTHWLQPRLIGIAHSIQEADELPRAPWDIPLDAIVTEKEWIEPAR